MTTPTSGLPSTPGSSAGPSESLPSSPLSVTSSSGGDCPRCSRLMTDLARALGLTIEQLRPRYVDMTGG